MTHHGFVRALTMIGVLAGVLCLPLACAHKPATPEPQCGLVSPTLYCCAIGVNGVLMSRC